MPRASSSAGGREHVGVVRLAAEREDRRVLEEQQLVADRVRPRGPRPAPSGGPRRRGTATRPSQCATRAARVTASATDQRALSPARRESCRRRRIGRPRRRSEARDGRWAVAARRVRRGRGGRAHPAGMQTPTAATRVPAPVLADHDRRGDDPQPDPLVRARHRDGRGRAGHRPADRVPGGAGARRRRAHRHPGGGRPPDGALHVDRADRRHGRDHPGLHARSPRRSTATGRRCSASCSTAAARSWTPRTARSPWPGRRRPCPPSGST